MKSFFSFEVVPILTSHDRQTDVQAAIDKLLVLEKQARQVGSLRAGINCRTVADYATGFGSCDYL